MVSKGGEEAEMAGVNKMEYEGREWCRIWHQGPATGRACGIFDIPASAIQALAQAALSTEGGSIHVRLADDPSSFVTLMPGVTWPLEQLAAGRAFSTLPSGADVPNAKAAEAWEGSKVGTMWNKSHGGHKMLDAGVLYHACCNGNGLHLFKQKHCEFHWGKPAAVEVWLTPAREQALSEMDADGLLEALRSAAVSSEAIAALEALGSALEASPRSAKSCLAKDKIVAAAKAARSSGAFPWDKAMGQRLGVILKTFQT